jgi:predicted short-subunit dehydrogenase-like oxidoreductase (DUF2520 family)
MDKSLALIGCGKAGLSVCLALKSSGWEVVGCLDRNPETAQQGAQWLACPVLKSLGEVPEGTVLLIGVPEAGFTEVDRRIAVEDRHLAGRVVLHLSGALPARALEICRLRGASVGSFHPLMTLPDPITGARRLKGATFTIEGRPAAVEVMKGMAQSLSGKSLTLSPKGKTLYHAAAVMASNHIVVLLSDCKEMLIKAGISPAEAQEAFNALAHGTVENVFAASPVATITGPVERGDLGTVKNHLQALKRYPARRERYRVLAQGALELARQRNPERSEEYDALAKLLAEWQSK